MNPNARAGAPGNPGPHDAAVLLSCRAVTHVKRVFAGQAERARADAVCEAWCKWEQARVSQVELFPAMVGQQQRSPLPTLTIPQYTRCILHTFSAAAPCQRSPHLRHLRHWKAPHHRDNRHHNHHPRRSRDQRRTTHSSSSSSSQTNSPTSYILIVRADKPQGRFLLVGSCLCGWGCCALSSRSTISNDNDKDTTNEEDNTDEDNDDNDGNDDLPEPVNRILSWGFMVCV